MTNTKTKTLPSWDCIRSIPLSDTRDLRLDKVGERYFVFIADWKTNQSESVSAARPSYAEGHKTVAPITRRGVTFVAQDYARSTGYAKFAFTLRLYEWSKKGGHNYHNNGL